MPPRIPYVGFRAVLPQGLPNPAAVAGLAGAQPLRLPQVAAGFIHPMVGDEAIHGVTA